VFCKIILSPLSKVQRNVNDRILGIRQLSLRQILSRRKVHVFLINFIRKSHFFHLVDVLYCLTSRMSDQGGCFRLPENQFRIYHNFCIFPFIFTSKYKEYYKIEIQRLISLIFPHTCSSILLTS